MIVPPIALVLGAALGFVTRGRRPLITAIAVAAPVLSVAALIAQFLPGGAEECRGSTTGAVVCQSLPFAITAWSGPLPYLIAALLIVLSLAPIISVRTRSWWVAAASAVLQMIPQVISFGGFIDWAPALLATCAVAFALLWSGRPTRPPELSTSR